MIFMSQSIIKSKSSKSINLIGIMVLIIFMILSCFSCINEIATCVVDDEDIYMVGDSFIHNEYSNFILIILPLCLIQMLCLYFNKRAGSLVLSAITFLITVFGCFVVEKYELIFRMMGGLYHYDYEFTIIGDIAVCFATMNFCLQIVDKTRKNNTIKIADLLKVAVVCLLVLLCVKSTYSTYGIIETTVPQLPGFEIVTTTTDCDNAFWLVLIVSFFEIVCFVFKKIIFQIFSNILALFILIETSLIMFLPKILDFKLGIVFYEVVVYDNAGILVAIASVIFITQTTISTLKIRESKLSKQKF